MKTLKSNISYKLYINGEQFIEDNKQYLNNNIYTRMETAFFFVNAQSYHKLNRRNYALRFKKEDKVLLILKLESFNTLVFGSKNLCRYAINVMADLNLVVGSVLGEKECIEAFLRCYQERLSGRLNKKIN